jgi:DNA-directed RNA polymerase specialized sigma24 family protein
VDEDQWLADRFEEHRARLRAVAYRMLGSLTEADDAVQDTWLHLRRSGAGEVDNLGGWLTTILARVCLNMLRSRNRRREQSLGVHLPDPLISPEGDLQPEEEALLADGAGLPVAVERAEGLLLTAAEARDAEALRAWFASHPGGPIDYAIRDLTVTGDVLEVQPNALNTPPPRPVTLTRRAVSRQ